MEVREKRWTRPQSFRMAPIDVEWLAATAKRLHTTASDILRRLIESAREGKVDVEEDEG